jgi:hypothetical protein
MAERGLSVDHTTIWRWTQTYGAEVYRRLRGEVKWKSSTWHMDETFVRIAGKWMYLFRAVDSQGQTVDFYLSETRDREAAKLFLRRALANPDNRRPYVLVRDGLRIYPAVIRELRGRRTIAPHVPTAHWPLLQQPNRIPPPSCEAEAASDAGTTDSSDCVGGNSRNRGSADDTQRTGARNHTVKSARSILGVSVAAGSGIRAYIADWRRSTVVLAQMQHFPDESTSVFDPVDESRPCRRRED